MVLDTVTGAPDPVWRFPIGLVGGVVATLWMDIAMARLPEGETPPSVAASVLTETHPGNAPRRLASVAHYLAGTGTGLLFVWLSLLVETFLGEPSITTALLTAVLLFVLMVSFFVLVPLALVPGLDDQRRRRVARDWALSAAAYLVVLVALVVSLSAVLA